MARVTVQETKTSDRSTLIIQAEGAQHWATLFFFHGLGDTCHGWTEPLKQFAEMIPGLKIIAPTAQEIPVTLNRGARCTAWCDLACASFNPLEFLQLFQTRPPLIETSWVEILGLVTEELKNHPNVPLSKMVFGGFSLGGHMASWAALQMPKSPAGILMLSGVVLGINGIQVKNQDIPILHCHGTQDQVIPFLGANMTKQQLQESGVKNYELKQYENMGHEARMDEIDYAKEFIARVLGQPANPVQASEEIKGLSLPLTICSNGVTIPKGTSVIVQNLKSKPEMNGQIGQITAFNPKTGRYSIQIGETQLALQGANIVLSTIDTETGQLKLDTASGELVDATSGSARKFKPSDMKLKTGTVLRLRGLQKAGSWNGSVGIVKSYNADSGRYLVDLGNNCQLQIKPDNFTC